MIQVLASVIDGSTTKYRLDALVKLFAIDLASGWISVAGRLDREVSLIFRGRAPVKSAFLLH